MKEYTFTARINGKLQIVRHIEASGQREAETILRNDYNVTAIFDIVRSF